MMTSPTIRQSPVESYVFENARGSRKGKKSSSGRDPVRRFLPALESLTERIVPASIINGNLYIFGTNADDNVTVTTQASTVTVVQNGVTQSFQRANLTGYQIWFMGYGGKDRYDALNSTGIRSIAYGGDGDDVLLGGEGNDTLVGEKGNDHIYGGVGIDFLYGAFFGSGSENGNDRLYGGNGDDVLFGGDGDDTLNGQNGNDVLLGENGNDRLFGAYEGYAQEIGGNDRLDGGNGDDLLYGGDGNDMMAGENGNDILNGGNGNDRLFGAFYGSTSEIGGTDYLNGGQGNDELRGGDGNDTLSGQTGHDRLYGDGGKDLIYGGVGNDVGYGGEGHDSLLGQDGNDSLDGDNGNDVVYGGNGDDWVYGGEGDDICFGGDGRDRVFGNGGMDLLGGGYLEFDPVRGVRRSTVSDWNYDDLWGGAGKDEFIIGDKKAPYWWWDKAVDKTSDDAAIRHGWFGVNGFWGFDSPTTFVRWGHLYSEIIA